MGNPEKRESRQDLVKTLRSHWKFRAAEDIAKKNADFVFSLLKMSWPQGWVRLAFRLSFRGPTVEKD